MDVPSGNFPPYFHPFVKCFDRNQAIEPAFEVKVSPHKVIKDSDLVSLVREIHRLRPTEVSIPAEYENAHCSSINYDLVSPVVCTISQKSAMQQAGSGRLALDGVTNSPFQ